MGMNKQTQEALKIFNSYADMDMDYFDAIDSLKKALEQPAQEPVAWNEEEFNNIAYAYRSCPINKIEMVSERYQELVDYVLSVTHPAQPLSDDEIINLIINGGWFDRLNDTHNLDHAKKETIAMVHVIEKAHGIGVRDE